VKLRTSLAASTAAVLALGGIAVGGSAAVAADAPEPTHEFLRAELIKTTTSETESELYNSWHFDPDHDSGVTQAPNGLISESDDVLIVLGNENDAIAIGEGPHKAESIRQLINSLGISTSHPEAVTFQVPIRFADGEASEWGWSTLRTAEDGSDDWISSQDIGEDIDAGLQYDLNQIITALADFDAAFPIAAGFHIIDTDVLVSSFTGSSELRV